jgi:hypothetical protein
MVQWTSLSGLCKCFAETTPDLYCLKCLLHNNFHSIEANVIIIAACIPTLRPFFSFAFKNEPTSKNQSRSRDPFNAIGSNTRFKLAPIESKPSQDFSLKSSSPTTGQEPTHGTRDLTEPPNEPTNTILHTTDISTTYSHAENTV